MYRKSRSPAVSIIIKILQINYHHRDSIDGDESRGLSSSTRILRLTDNNLHEMTVHVWIVDIREDAGDESANFNLVLNQAWKERAFARVDPLEAARIRGMTDSAAAMLSLVGWLLLAKLSESLPDELGDHRHVEWTRDPHGRPIMKVPNTDTAAVRASALPNHWFNVSHDGSLVALAYGPCSHRIGIDIVSAESALHRRQLLSDTIPNHEITSFLNDMRAALNACEWVIVDAYQNPMDRLQAFLRFWTAKESYSKALGVGIAGLEVGRMRMVERECEMRENSVTFDVWVDGVHDSQCVCRVFDEGVFGTKQHMFAFTIIGDNASILLDRMNVRWISPDELV